MSKVMKTVIQPAVTHSVVAHIVCDLCGRESKHGESWREGRFEAAGSTVELKVGTNYPDGGKTVTNSFDVCPACFTGKLIPWMESQGATPTVEERYW